MSISRGAIAGSPVGDTMNGMANQIVDALPRVLFFGMTGSFSRSVLATLLAAHVPICGYILPAAPQAESPLQRVEPPQGVGRDDEELLILNPMRTQNSIQLAWQHNIPIFEAGNLRAPAVQNFVAKLAPDVACVACFDKRIPPALLAMPRHGFLNVHPSLLPAYRGPAPLFWQWRNGETQTGVTVHWDGRKVRHGRYRRPSPHYVARWQQWAASRSNLR
jgi:methionyl-tRNA formyltransferase